MVGMSDTAVNQKVTVYLEPRLRKALKLWSADLDKSNSDLVNLALQQYFEDLSDIAAIEARRDEPGVPLEDLRKLLKKDGVL